MSSASSSQKAARVARPGFLFGLIEILDGVDDLLDDALDREGGGGGAGGAGGWGFFVVVCVFFWAFGLGVLGLRGGGGGFGFGRGGGFGGAEEVGGSAAALDWVILGFLDEVGEGGQGDGAEVGLAESQAEGWRGW